MLTRTSAVFRPSAATRSLGAKGKHKYLTPVYQIDSHCKRLLWIGRKRKVKTLLGFFRWFGAPRGGELKSSCSDMWKPYLKVIAKKAGQAVHILDRFHIMAHFSKALDEVRAKEVKALKVKGYDPVLTKTRWQRLLLPGEFDREAGDQAGGFAALQPALGSGLSVEGIVPAFLELYLALLGGRLSSGVVEGFNTKAKLASGKSFGFRICDGAEIASYHALGILPEPEFTHRFC